MSSLCFVRFYLSSPFFCGPTGCIERILRCPYRSAPTPAIIATGGSLSDYSYSSSYSSSSDLDDDDDDHFHTSTSTDPSSSNTTGTTSARSYAKYITKDDEGTRSAGLLDGDDDDPFADPTTVTVAGDGEGSYGRHGIREEWKEL